MFKSATSSIRPYGAVDIWLGRIPRTLSWAIFRFLPPGGCFELFTAVPSFHLQSQIATRRETARSRVRAIRREAFLRWGGLSGSTRRKQRVVCLQDGRPSTVDWLRSWRRQG